MLLRRRMMGSEEVPLYWWDSEDALVYGTYWIDRVQEVPATANNGNKVDGLYELQINDYSPERVFNLGNLNTGASKIVLPAAWKCVCEFKIPSGMTANGDICMIFDLGSLTNASHAFGLYYKPSLGKINVNYKPIGNNTNYVLSNYPVIETDKIVEVEFGTYYTSGTTVKLYLKYNNEIYYGKAEHNAVAYNGNWALGVGYFGKGHITSYCGGKCYLKSLKFYNNE